MFDQFALDNHLILNKFPYNITMIAYAPKDNAIYAYDTK